MRRSPPPDGWAASGLPRRACFAHEVAWLDKPYPDTFLQLERRGVGEDVAGKGRAWQLNLYARDLEGFPEELFRDTTVNWHRQQMGRPGLVGAAGVHEADGDLFVTLMQSDLCQQIFRNPELRRRCKTRLDNRFGEWPALLLNAVLDAALARGLGVVYVPTAGQILSGIKRAVDPTLFSRIYDEPPQRYPCRRVRIGAAEYWAIAPAAARGRVVALEAVAAPEASAPRRPTICVFHDIEGGVDTGVSEAQCREHLLRMLSIEAGRGVRATYNVLGTLFAATRDVVAAHGHAVGFHTFDHAAGAHDQLSRVRELDLQVRGYRPARSVLTPELTEYRLAYLNFEWLLCSRVTFGFEECRLEGGIAKIPVHLDDYSLHTGETTYPAWIARLRRLLVTHPFVAIGLHDCYARHWLDPFDDLLAELAATGTLTTCDDVADATFLASDTSGAAPRR